MPEFGGIGGFAAGAMAANEEALRAKELKIKDFELSSRLQQIEMEKQKFRQDQIKTMRENTLNSFRFLEGIIKQVQGQIQPSHKLYETINMLEKNGADIFGMTGEDPSVISAYAESLRTLARTTKPAEQTGLMGEAAFVEPGDTEAQKKFVRDVRLKDEKGVSVKIENTGPIPAGQELVVDEKTGAKSLRDIPGGPAEQKKKAQEQADLENANSIRESAATVIDAGKRAMELANAPGLPTTGFFGALSKALPGSPAHDLFNLLQTIKANIGFDTLAEMRKQSPTGGALGQVTEFELKSLQAAMSSLEQSQTDKQFKTNLQNVLNRYERMVSKLPGGAAPAPKPQSPAETANPYAGMTDEQVLEELKKQGIVK